MLIKLNHYEKIIDSKKLKTQTIVTKSFQSLFWEAVERKVITAITCEVTKTESNTQNKYNGGNH